MRTSASPNCCMIWSGLHQRVIDEAIDHVVWKAARLCENYWTRLQTLALINFSEYVSAITNIKRVTFFSGTQCIICMCLLRIFHKKKR